MSHDEDRAESIRTVCDLLHRNASQHGAVAALTWREGERWRSLSCLLGEQVRADVAGRIVAGKVLGLRATGELILLTEEGEERLLASEKAARLL